MLKMNMTNFVRATAACSALILCSANAQAEQRLFTYSYETSVLPEGELEFEQWITNQNGREEGDYSQWNLRSELEYGLTKSDTVALYLNWDATRIGGLPDVEDENKTEFKGFSVENIYQILNPNLDPVGLALYGEFGSDGIDYSFEGKLLLSKSIDEVTLVANAVYEAEFEKEDGETVKEAELEFTFGASYSINPNFSVGLEARNKSAYPDGLDLTGQEYQTWSVGPNFHYSTPKWWATLTILPQVWGNGDGAEGDRQLVHEESLETRLLIGFDF